MKKLLLKLTALVGIATIATPLLAQQRYVNDVFTDYTRVTNVPYDSNRSVNILYNTGYPIPSINNSPIITANLVCDIYSPVNDTNTKRPLVIVAHTGSFLPKLVNQQTTGSKDDSAIVELCSRFAKKGYVAVALNYRLGWRATSQVQAVATEDLLKATYRGMQDVRNCIRFFRTNATTYGIDTSKIIVGGQGTGGYIALAFGTVDKRAEIESNVKFLRGDFTPMVNADTLGDWTGVGGNAIFNYGGDAAVASNAHMVFNYGGSMGDSTWLEASSLPMVSLHVATDPFAPFYTGDVRVPNGPTVIPSASGAGAFMPLANTLGVNNKINGLAFNDAYSTRAMQASNNVKNLFPFYTTVAPDGAPWEWWDKTGIQGTNSGVFYVYPMPANGNRADSLSSLTNPFMSATKGRAYIDTVVNFVAPRIAAQLDLAVFSGVKEITNVSQYLTVYPNPASDVININLDTKAGIASNYKIVDITGRVLVNEKAQSNNISIQAIGINPGLYFVYLTLKDGNIATKRVIVKH